MKNIRGCKMRKFEMEIDGKKYKGTFDVNSNDKENMYILFHHNGLIGIRNPTGIDDSIIRKLLVENKDKSPYQIFKASAVALFTIPVIFNPFAF